MPDDKNYYDSDRYDSAAGWDGSDRGNKKWVPPPPRKPVLYVLPQDEEDARSMRPLQPLFGDLWSEREVAVLAGETGVGKSVLAVQLAELLARGRLSPHVTAKRVLYVDFEHTTNQFEDRYATPRHPGHRVRRIRYRFSKLFQRVVPGFDQEPEAKFRGNVGRYFCNELGRAIDLYEADIAIVDNLSFLMMGGRSGAAAERAMLALRTITRAFKTPVSILVTAHLRTERTPGPISLGDLAGSRRIAELADTVFTLARSSASEDLRYLKHLKSRTGDRSLTSENTAVLQLSRLAAPPSMSNAKRRMENSGSSSLSIHNLQLTLGLPLPFLGLTHVAFSDESVHLNSALRNPHSAIKRVRSRKDDDLIEFILSGKYARYLER